MADTKKTVHLIIERQDSPTGKPYTEEFEIPYRPALNVVAALMEIQKNPVTKDGKLLLQFGNATAQKKYVVLV